MSLTQRQHAMKARKAMKAMGNVPVYRRFDVYMSRLGSHWVYLIGNKEHNWFKIGISKWPERRLMELQVLPFELEIVTTVAVKQEHARAIEKRLHTEYADRRVRGEWFQGIETKDFLVKVQQIANDLRP